MTDHRLNNFLKQAADVPPPAEDFERRILAAAEKVQQEPAAPLREFPRLTAWRAAASVLLFAAGLMLSGAIEKPESGYGIQDSGMEIVAYLFEEDGGML